jgi:hypothetical protein
MAARAGVRYTAQGHFNTEKRMKHMNPLLDKLQADVSKSLAAIRAEAERMDGAAATVTGGKVAAITVCPVPHHFSNAITSFGSSHSSYGPPHWTVSAKAARDALAKARADNEAQHDINLPLMENNARIAAQVQLIMGNLGIPAVRTTYGYPTPRAKKMVERRVTAGYLDDLNAVCKTTDGYDAVKQKCDDFEKRIAAFETTERAKELEAERAQERVQAERAKLTLLGALANKYGCEAEYDDVITALAGRDKYFALGYWLFRNRNSWHDGTDRARRGLDLFAVESEDDRLVHEDISGRIDNWSGDGRVFRDSPYGYDYLLGKTDVDIAADFGKLQEAGLVPED